MDRLTTIALVTGVYLLISLAIGWVAYRRSQAGADDYFLGGRSARTVVLFMALFGTNVTPFVLLGIPAQTYHQGIGVFGLNAAIIALGVPLTFYLIGFPAYLAARRIGALTPAELYAERFQSPLVGLVLFVAYFVFTIPYMVIAVLGVGHAASVLSGGAIPSAAAEAAALVITLVYTSLGGMRATMWTNVFQGTVFLGLMLAATAWIAGDYGGLAAAMERVQEARPELLLKGDVPAFAAGPWASWGLVIALTVIGFPHILVRLFAARDAAALKNACRLYPLIMIVLWVPAVLLGLWGAVELPGLAGKEADRILPMMIEGHLPPWVQGLALAAVLAAVMSTLDAQLLTLSSMLSRDVLGRFFAGLRDRAEVVSGRIFLLLIAALVFAIVLADPPSIYALAGFAFSGYVVLVPVLYLGLRWRRMNAAGAIASLVAGNLALGLAMLGWLPAPGGILPVVWGLGAAIAGAVLGSVLGPATPAAARDRVLAPIERVFEDVGPGAAERA
ncbi:MAG: sodium:solute symporter family protein [Myxococcales bacterium]|nr:sodium:solute symporter family protein [Myxococcales bacterium]